ncbi:hypothetical protein CAPTEDRAFT_125390 [Capitella teleta]|uniref:Aquaglyceroporin-3 n=1 Tax=Capitella teleta TaxID=283909 RepID=R7TUJ7_CAPTE|nr:hypothetical protein CAPTEDRAFT_125390 [Capitella teleta]|eukprot:ELT97593.1 hypothetical protein CAPTEDRAFT_125390 [Capitella teleta]
MRIRNQGAREFCAEFLGTMILIIIGDGSVAQSVLSSETAGAFHSVNWAWGLAVAMGVWVSVGVSGGHINPAVTLTMCILRKCPWKKLLPYWLAQYLGAFAGAAVVYGVYYDALNAFDGGVRQVDGINGTAGIWATYPKEFLSAESGFGDQLVGTAMLVCLVMAITDKRNANIPSGIQPLCIGLVVVAIGMSFGFNCGYAINPARDLGPRVLTAIAGWGDEVFTYRDYNWFWVPLAGPHVGAMVGAALYEWLVGLHFPDEEEYMFNNEPPHELNQCEFLF